MVMQDIKLTSEKHAPALRTISMAMRIRRYGAESIVQYGRSRATLDATERRNRASICPILPRRTPWLSISAYKIELWHCETLFEDSGQKAQNGPSTQLI